MIPRLLIFLLGIVGISSCMNKKTDFIVIGHRGAMGHETENTLASVQKALDLGVDMIEIDVFKIESGEIAVFHDDRVDRLTSAGGYIEDFNLIQLRQLVLEGGHKIPMLQNVLKLIDHQVPINIELKGANTAERVNFIIQHYIKTQGWTLDDFLISSFNWNELQKMREFNKEIAIAVLTEEDPITAIPMAKELDAIAINPNYELVTYANVQKIHDAGFKVYTWTVNEITEIERIQKLEVDGIFTNYPERIK